jgi:glycosyltransferase involved in cell wall biosynthesis
VLRDASLLALPSHHENFGLCVMESLACGVPVLISPHVNLAPEIKAASAGWIAEVNVAAIEQALAVAFSSEEERLTRGRNGKQLAVNYAWGNIAHQLCEVYSEIIPKADEVIPKSDEAISALVQHA